MLNNRKPVISRDLKKQGAEIITIWQGCDENEVPNEAIQVEQFSDCVTIRQRDSVVTINPETVPMLCGLLKQLSRKGGQ